MKTYTLTTLFVIALVLAACQPAKPIPLTATLTPEPSTYTLTSTITPTPTVGPGGFPRRFHVVGNAYVDQFGQKMIFRGITTMDPDLMALSGDPNMPSFDENYFREIASWGANIIRVQICPYSTHTYAMGDTLRTLDQTIAWSGENHMYVIIEFCGIGWLPTNWWPDPQMPATSVEEWTSFWQVISGRYANNDVVAFYELFNEPQQNAHTWEDTAAQDNEYWAAWNSLVDPLINKTIRPNDPDKIIIVGGLSNSANPSFAATAPIADISNNIAYAAHAYPARDAWNRAIWDSFFGDLSSKYPVFGDVGYQNDMVDYKDTVHDGIPYHKAIIAYMEEHHMSWEVSNFSANWSTTLLEDNATYKPTDAGLDFRSLLLELNGQP